MKTNKQAKTDLIMYLVLLSLVAVYKMAYGMPTSYFILVIAILVLNVGLKIAFIKTK